MNLSAAVGSLRLADAVGASVDRSLVDGAYYARVSNFLQAELGLETGTSRLNASYGLRLVPNPLTLKAEPFHTAELRYTYSAPRYVLSFAESGGIGRQLFLGAGRASPLAGLPPINDPKAAPVAAPPLATPTLIDSTALPAAKTLTYVSLRTSASLLYRWDHRTSSSLLLGYQLGGGLTEAARRYVALQQMVDASLSLGYTPSARTNLVTALVVARGWNSLNDDYGIATLSQSFLYKWTDVTTTDVGLGISSRVTQGPDDSTIIVTTPVGALGVTHILKGRDTTGTLRLGITYNPLVDIATGRIQNRLGATATAGVAHGDVAAGIGGSVWQVIPSDDPGASRGVTGNIFGSYQIVSWLGASLSAQITNQAYLAAGLGTTTPLPSGFAWGVYGGLYAVSPTWRF